jgi:hypothetical protein
VLRFRTQLVPESPSRNKKERTEKEVAANEHSMPRLTRSIVLHNTVRAGLTIVPAVPLGRSRRRLKNMFPCMKVSRR